MKTIKSLSRDELIRLVVLIKVTIENLSKKGNIKIRLEEIVKALAEAVKMERKARKNTLQVHPSHNKRKDKYPTSNYEHT